MSDIPVAWHWGAVDARYHGPHETRLTHRDAACDLWVRNDRLAAGRGYAAAPATARRELAHVGAILRLRGRGRYHLHASGAVAPEGRAWLLAGDSGAGKSTLAYSLARAGWRVLGDDTVILEMSGRGLIAHPWHAPLQVSSILAVHFPEIASRQPDSARIDRRARVPMPVERACASPVMGITILERAASCRVELLSPVVALAMLIRQSPWVAIDDEASRAHLDVLRHIAAVLPVVRMSHTPAELSTFGRALTEMVA
ncbi:MAG: hypothetical protein ACRENI_09465 [Gemmatimonadaceae bacterium]